VAWRSNGEAEVPRAWWIRLSLTFFVTGIFWLLIDLFGYLDWNKGPQRAILLLSVMVTGAVMALPGRHLRAGTRTTQKELFSWIIALSIAGLILYDIVSESEFGLILGAAIIVFISSVPLAGTFASMRVARIERLLPLVLSALLLPALMYRLGTFLYLVNSPDLIDIAQTTLAAGKAVLAGENPYSIPIDVNPAYPDYAGYKYLPLMFLAYLPLTSAIGATGIRLTNLILDLTTAMLVGWLGRRQCGFMCGALAASLYLMLPMLPRDLYMNGVTDLAAMVPLLIAMALYKDRPSLAGIMVGLSVSVKILPGFLFYVCWLPRVGRSRYLGGLLLGLIPALVFFLWAPGDFMQNIVWFIATRPADTTSWLYGAPTSVVSSARLGFVIVLALICCTVLWRSPNFLTRCALNIVCIAATLLAGPVVHNNYMLWWIPLFCILLGANLTRLLAL
jgi:hypothetical protein